MPADNSSATCACGQTSVIAALPSQESTRQIYSARQQLFGEFDTSAGYLLRVGWIPAEGSVDQ
jgi:hypothetical protein